MEHRDTNDFSELYETFRKPLFKFIQYKVSDRHIAEEILNDVFLKAYTSIDTLEEKKSLKSWLYAIASNRIIDHYRKKQPLTIEIEDEILMGEEKRDSVYSDFDCCLNDFLDQLPPSNAEALKAVYFDEMTQQEYAEKSALNLSTVKSHVHRGKRSLKHFFEQCCSFEKDKHHRIIDFHKK
ncbi:sigma-70 family RNA polymerase sigma factor [Sulfurovum sp.]|uniref:sigma-70 family RNA polymerase sigma factor n=1 Tax=Sulfurovum sp. TaxID=1969726 RepID=UPI002A368379|nr:sigma-70 family RNA polymerase sigma factor [Sulfurovum sp.]MDY0402213.1 sigma-70 family RNA polymerase sigma factor [Sulfurovum sp.]